jgi:PilZ domain
VSHKTSNQKSRRIRERLSLALPVRVLCRETVDYEWTEMSRLIDVTPFGARLTLKRPVEIGRLLHLTLAMPRRLRVFDHAEDQYRVWSLIRNVKLLDAAEPKSALIEIGVAFIGKQPPRNFGEDPSRRYDIAKQPGESMSWIKDLSDELRELSETDKRKETRHHIPLEVLIEAFNKDGAISQTERTVTENVSRRGACVFTSLPLSPGAFVKISSEQYQAVSLAVVRASRPGPDGMPRLHLEFVGKQWPLD